MRAVLACLLLLIGCGPTVDGQGAASRRDAILGGATDSTSTNVFILDLRFDNGQAAICSAVLVSPRVLLTAAHCVEPSLKGATSVTVRAANKTDANTLMGSDVTNVTTIARDPGWDPAAGASPHDLAALLLASAPPTATPAPLLRSLPGGFQGQAIRVVGYGTTTSGGSDSAIRRSASLTAGAVGTNTFDFGVAGALGICSGDSGGPSFFSSAGQERVAGIHSRTNSGSCGSGTDIRVDAHLGFIDGFITANDPPLCSADGRCATGCPSLDPDCPTACGMNGVCELSCPSPDPDCCTANATCDLTCPAGVVDPDCCTANGRCDTMCPAGVRDPDCVCVADGACEMTCPTGVTDPDCRCRADGTCESSCPTGATDPDCGCGADDVCVASCPVAAPDPDCAHCGSDGVCSTASCPAQDPDCHLDGEVCTAPSECIGRECVADPRGFSFCSRSCTTSAVCQLDMVCSAGMCRAPVKDEEPVRGGCASVPGLPLFGLWALLGAARPRRSNRPRPES
ncbi:MAG: trypsin-like serine protease [Myxococcota bacterium]